MVAEDTRYQRLAGLASSEAASFSSACHGAGRAMSRHAALKAFSGRHVQDDLAARGILVRSPSTRASPSRR